MAPVLRGVVLPVPILLAADHHMRAAVIRGTGMWLWGTRSPKVWGTLKRGGAAGLGGPCRR